MKHPPYHLRSNKAIDRFLLLEVIRRLDGFTDLAKCTYYGFGGPYLQDFRLMAERFPDMPLVSIEESAHTLRRQKFHLPSKKVTLLKSDFKSFLTTYSGAEEAIFWVDNVGLKFSHFDDFMQLLTRVRERSIVKITVEADTRKFPFNMATAVLSESFLGELQQAFLESFERKYSKVLPGGMDSSRFRPNTFPELLQDMVQIAAQLALPASTGVTFQVLCTCVYSDGTEMLTVTGVVSRISALGEVRRLFRDWPFANLTWRAPRRIDVPVLTVKERLKLEEHLPCAGRAGQRLLGLLGYNVARDRSESLKKMRQYAAFYGYYPHFVRVVI